MKNATGGELDKKRLSDKGRPLHSLLNNNNDKFLLCTRCNSGFRFFENLCLEHKLFFIRCLTLSFFLLLRKYSFSLLPELKQTKVSQIVRVLIPEVSSLCLKCPFLKCRGGQSQSSLLFFIKIKKPACDHKRERILPLNMISDGIILVSSPLTALTC